MSRRYREFVCFHAHVQPAYLIAYQRFAEGGTSPVTQFGERKLKRKPKTIEPIQPLPDDFGRLPNGKWRLRPKEEEEPGPLPEMRAQSSVDGRGGSQGSRDSFPAKFRRERSTMLDC